METYEREEEREAQAQAPEREGVREPLAQVVAQGDEEAAVEEPWFPELEDAVDANQQSLVEHGQTNHALLRPDVLEGALGRPKNYYYYENNMPKAAAALAHGVGQAQAFEDGNKRTAYHLTRLFLDHNGLGHISPADHDDDELADHLVGYGEGTHTMEHTADLFAQRDQQGPKPMVRQTNILDPIHDQLDPRVWDNAASSAPTLKEAHSSFIYERIFTVLEQHSYDGMEEWLSLVFTGSLTTYQYSDKSDVDISLFVDAEVFPDWSRAEIVGIMVENIDGTQLPGTPFPIQAFVVSAKLTKEDLYKPGLRSGYDLGTDTWIVPPDRSRVHDVEREMNESYTIALENADKMEKLLRYEPDKAIMFWHQIHKRRQRDHQNGRGDYSPSNITYKMLANRGLFPQIAEVSGEYIA